MSQGKKVVTVLDAESCQRREVAVDEARYTEFHKAFMKNCFDQVIAPNVRAEDATEATGQLVSQFAYTEAEVYNREYQDMQFRQLIPISSEAGPDAETVRYQVYDRVGQGKRISGAGKDIPYSDVATSTTEIGVVTGGAGYRYTQDELLKAARMIRPLPAERMATAIEMSERHLNQVAMLGERTDVAGQAQFYGLLNQAGVTPVNDGTSGYNHAWADAATTFDKILADVNKLILKFWTDSNFTLFPDTFGLAPQCFEPLATRYNALGTRTLLQMLEESNLATARTKKPMNFVPILQANNVGIAGSAATGKSRCVLYCNDKRRLVFHVPMPHRFLAPQPEGLSVDVPGWYKYAGVNLRYGYAMVYADNMEA